MKQHILSVLAVALVCAGCEKKTETPPAPPSTPATKPATPPSTPPTPTPAPGDEDTILLGEVGSLTGSEAAFGISTRNGIEMAIEEANAAGGVKGKKLAVRVYDDQSKSDEAGTATSRLITQDHVKVILGEVASQSSLNMAPHAQEAKVPMITPASTNPKVTQVGDYIFRVCFIDPFQGYVMAKYAKETLKLKKIAILIDRKSAYSVGLAESFQQNFKKLGGEIAGEESFSNGDSDFRAQLTNMKKLKVDGLYIPAYYQAVAVIADQAKELGVKVTMLGGDGWDAPEKLVELGGSAVEGSYFSDHYTQDDPRPTVQEFLKKYQAKYKGIPDAMAALGYDAARVAIEAMRRAKDLSGPAIRDEIAATRDFDGVTGSISIDKDRNTVKPAVVLKVEGGKFKYMAAVPPP